jgi:DNA-binding NarL/FixJ family response regulator
MIRVFIAEDQKTVQQILKSYLELEPDIEVVGTATNGQLALEQIELLKPDVAIVDIEMPEVDGLTATQAISQRFSETKVLILSVHDNERYLNNALQVGAKGYLLKTTPPKDLVNAIRAVHQGYFQLSPGLIEKFYTEKPEKIRNFGQAPLASYKKGQGRIERTNGAAVNLIQPETSILQTFGSETISFPQQSRTKNNGRYLLLGLLLNVAVWALVLAYLKFFPQTYTSKWGIKILETNPGVEVVLSDETIALSDSGYRKPLRDRDPRTDYVYLAKNRTLLDKAAKKFDMPVKEFGEPKIKIDEASGLIAFEIKGKSPAEAQHKAWIMQELIVLEIDRLRRVELKRQEKETQVSLESARRKLNAAQEQLSKYKTSSDFGSQEQIEKLSATIEELRRQRVDVVAQEQGLKNRFSQLSGDLKLSSKEAADAYKLQADNVYKQYLEEYSQNRRELAKLTSQFTSRHPAYKAKQAQVNESASALQKQANFVLGRTVSLDKLNNLALSTTTSTRDDMFKDLVTNRADRQKLVGQDKQLEAQIATLETRLHNLSKQKIQVDRLKRDLQVAEAVFAATLAKLELSKQNIYSNYPPAQLVIEPSLPETKEATTPSTSSALLGGLAGSFLLTTGIFLLHSDKSKS